MIQREKQSETPKLKQTSILTFTSTMLVSLSKIDVLKGLLHSVTVDGRPLSSVEDGWLNIAFAPAMKRLPVKYNRKNIVDLMEKAAIYVRNKLTGILENSLISVKVDGVSRFSKSYLGINVQVSQILFTNIMNKIMFFINGSPL